MMDIKPEIAMLLQYARLPSAQRVLQASTSTPTGPAERILIELLSSLGHPCTQPTPQIKTRHHGDTRNGHKTRRSDATTVC